MMLNLVGRTFGRLTVEVRAGATADYRATWTCACTCGSRLVVVGKSLTSGNTTSCGCAQRDAFARSRELGYARRRVSPGRKRARTAWYDMHRRCSNPEHASYRDYGGRGITVCPEWASFDQFFADMGEPPKGLSLDRIDNSSGYTPHNCRWVSTKEQQRNKRTNVYVDFAGERLTVQDWAKRLGTQYNVIARRIKLWGVELALTTPVTKRKPLVFRKQRVAPQGDRG